MKREAFSPFVLQKLLPQTVCRVSCARLLSRDILFDSTVIAELVAMLSSKELLNLDFRLSLRLLLWPPPFKALQTNECASVRLVHISNNFVKEQHETDRGSVFFHLCFDEFSEWLYCHLESLVTYALDFEVGYTVW